MQVTRRRGWEPVEMHQFDLSLLFGLVPGGARQAGPDRL